MSRGKTCDDEIEKTRLKFTMPTSWPYLKIKSQLTNGCMIRVTKCMEELPKRYYDMPDIENELSLESDLSSFPDLCDDAYDILTLLGSPGSNTEQAISPPPPATVICPTTETPVTPESNPSESIDWVNCGLNSVLTPEATPRAGDRGDVFPLEKHCEISDSTGETGSARDDSFCQPNGKAHFDPLEWLNKYDNLTQLLLSCVISCQYQLFSYELERYVSKITNNHLVACVELLLRLPAEEVLNFLRTVLNDISTFAAKAVMSSVIVEVLLYAVRNEDYQPMCFELLSLSRRFNLNLCQDKGIIQNPNIQRVHICLLIADLYLEDGDVEGASDLLCSEKVISKMLNDGYSRRNQFVLYGKVLNKVLQCIYKEKKHQLALKIAKFNLNRKCRPPEIRVWGPLALATVLGAKKCRKRHLVRLGMVLLSTGLPEILQRATFVELLRAGREEASDFFSKAPVYLTARKVLPANKGNIRKRLCLCISEAWTEEEMEQSILWFCNEIKTNRKVNFEVELTISIQPDTKIAGEKFDPILKDVELCIAKKLLKNKEANSMQRLCRTLWSMKPQLISSVQAPNTLRVFPSSLTPYLH